MFVCELSWLFYCCCILKEKDILNLLPTCRVVMSGSGNFQFLHVFFGQLLSKLSVCIKSCFLSTGSDYYLITMNLLTIYILVSRWWTVKQRDIACLVTEIELNDGICIRVIFFFYTCKLVFFYIKMFCRIMRSSEKHTMYHTLCMYLAFPFTETCRHYVFIFWHKETRRE
jgi:hypothetical protein